MPYTHIADCLWVLAFSHWRFFTFLHTVSHFILFLFRSSAWIHSFRTSTFWGWTSYLLIILFLLLEKSKKLLFANCTVSIYINLSKKFFDRLLRFFGLLEEFCYFFNGDFPRMINVKVLKCSFVMFFSQILPWIDSCYQKLCEIDISWSIQIH